MSLDEWAIRDFTIDDFDFFYKIRSDPEHNRYLDRDLPSSFDEVQKIGLHILEEKKTGSCIPWVIVENSTSNPVGLVSIWNIRMHHFRGELGYGLLTKYKNKGIMSKILPKVINYGFQSLGLHSLEANVNPMNTASIRLLEKNGFIREAYFKENWYYNGQFLDSAIYGLINPA